MEHGHTEPNRRESRWALGLVAAAVGALGCWFFGGLVGADRIAANGDGPLYYDPLFRFIQRQWSAGHIPLWNPYDNLGLPLVALGTTSIFYPGKVLFFLPMTFERAYGLYLFLHILLAAYAAFRLARHWQCSRYAAGIAALAYAFSGQVLYQFSYVVFLVSAAWLPIALEASDRMLRGRSLRAALGLAVVLALMTLGGDPQMAYHAGLIAIVQALWLWRQDRQERSSGGIASISPGGWLRSRPFLLAVAAGGALCLTAIQVLPTSELARHGDRTITDAARSLYEIPTALGHDNAAQRISGGFLARFASDTYQNHLYNFSVAPWRLAELVWPNCGGRQFPTERRWFDCFEFEFWLWTPSLYLGLLPLFLACLRFRLRGGEPLDRALSWLALAAILASFGRYGLGWLIQHLAPISGPIAAATHTVGQPFGGLYWLMTYLLPGYIQFRLPGKLFTLATVAIALLAARGWDLAMVDSRRKLRRLAAWTAAISVLGILVAVAIRPWWAGWFTPPHEHPLFGPLDAHGAASDVLWALVHTIAVCGLIGWLVGRRFGPRAAWCGPVALAITAVDLAVASGWLVATLPADILRQPPKLGAVVRDAAVEQDLVEPQDAAEEQLAGEGREERLIRIHRKCNWVPWRWSQSRAFDRWQEIVAWDHDTLMVNHHLDAGVGSAEVWGTMMPSDFRAWIGLGGTAATQRFASLLLREPLLGERPGGEGITGPIHLPFVDDVPIVSDVSLWRNEKAMPRAWIARNVQRLEPIDEANSDALLARTREVLIEGDRLRDFVARPVVEGGPAPPADMGRSRSPPAASSDRPVDEKPNGQSGERWQLVSYEPDRVEITAQLTSPGLFVLADQFYPGWALHVETDGQESHEVPILRTNRVLRGSWLPAGCHRLVYQYRPASFAWGARITLAALLATILWSLLLLRRR